MKVLLTGATGFLGAHLVYHLLHKGYSVKVLKRNNSNLKEFEFVGEKYATPSKLLTSVEWIEGNILDTFSLEKAMKGVEQVYHTAAIVSFWKQKHEEMLQTNVAGTANVVNCALEAGVKKLCYASSIAALGREKNGDIIDENTPWRDSKYNTKYALSKYLAELEVWRGIEEGLDAVIVNPGLIIGEGLWNKGSCRLIETAHKGLKFYTTGQNGYVDVMDVCRAMIQLAESDITAQRYIMVAENIVFKDFFTRLATQFGKQGPAIKITPLMAQLARIYYSIKAKKGEEPLITAETARNSQAGFTYINTKIKNDLGFEFTPMDETIKRVCKAYLESVR